METLIFYGTKGHGIEDNRTVTFSGRIPQWEFAIAQMDGRWLSGYGFGAGPRIIMSRFGVLLGALFI